MSRPALSASAALRCGALASMLATPALAQGLLRTIVGADPTDPIGASLAWVGDADGDGVSDLAMTSVPPLPRAPRVELVSGRTGALLWSVSATGAPAYVAAVGDFDRDGRADVAVVAPGGAGRPRAAVLAGTNGATLQSIAVVGSGMGVVGGLGLVDGDAIPDVAVAVVGVDRVSAYSGGSGNAIWQVNLGNGSGLYGTALATDVDFDGDGARDVAVGGPGARTVWLLDGRSTTSGRWTSPRPAAAGPAGSRSAASSAATACTAVSIRLSASPAGRASGCGTSTPWSCRPAAP